MNQIFSIIYLCVIVSVLIPSVPAPVPRCSPFIIINKLAEFSNLVSDSNPYFPVPPCEYGGPLEAIRAGDYEAVFVLARPELVPRHNFYELVWFLKFGAERLGRILRGEEKFIADQNILREGYQHYTPYVRTRQIGHDTFRDPIIINDKRLYNRIVGSRLRWLFADKGITRRHEGQKRISREDQTDITSHRLD
ncbi:uncharacterized protein [Lepeophtheirus salmonis]|uniref:Uncharacterized protein n=1 Tax=Lepeophtheirus salmonis TaxID=72036 RepID=A0A0K2VAJ2_LEPSM|nr:uncharacterized protein LOC121116490 [Lepeophtheirus salmonis]